MIHKLHADSGDYFASSRDYGHVHYPQSLANCATCHDNNRMPKPEGRSDADKVAFQSRPSEAACGTCHTIDFDAHFRAGGETEACLTCHGAGKFASVDQFHISVESTPNNPLQPEGFVQFAYEVASVSLNELNQPVVKFRILADGTPLDFGNLPAGVTLGNVRFRAAWSMPQPESFDVAYQAPIAAPADFNNFGPRASGRQWYELDVAQAGRVSFDQPANVAGNVAAWIGGVTGPDAEGFYETAPGINTTTPFAFPDGAMMRSIGLEGRPQVNGTNVQTPSVIAAVGTTGKTARREIVDVNNCNACHEMLVFHGGGRTDGVDWCVACHNPENSSSNIFEGVIPGGPFDTPVQQLPMNLKDLVHGLHAGKPVGGDPIRTDPFAFIRGTLAGGSGNGPYDFSDIGFPASPADCEVCHRPGTHTLPISPDALWSVVDGFPAASIDQPTYMVNLPMNERIPPAWASCAGCHNTPDATAHFELNTAEANGEACAVCHAPGRAFEAHTQ